MNYNKIKFLKILDTIRNFYGSQNKMAEALGVSSSYITKIYDSNTQNPPAPEYLKRIADNSKSLTTYDELMATCGYIDDNMSKSDKLDMIKEITYYIDKKERIEKKIKDSFLTKDEEQYLISKINKIKETKMDNLVKLSDYDNYDEYLKMYNKVLSEKYDINNKDIRLKIAFSNMMMLDALNTYIDELGKSNIKKTVKIPLLGKVAAGEPIWAEENIEEYLEIDEELAKKGEFFALTIKGDSMFPYLLNDDILIVRKQDDVESGDIAVVLINGDEATVKQVFKNSDGIMLTAFNQQVWQPKTYTNEEIEKLPVKIIGRFAELRRRKFM